MSVNIIFNNINQLIQKILNSKLLLPEDISAAVGFNRSLINYYYTASQELKKSKQGLIDDFDEANRTRNIEQAKQIDEQLTTLKAICDLYYKRIELAIIDKLKELNYQLDFTQLNQIAELLFHRDLDQSVKDIRVVNRNGIAIMTDNGVIVSDNYYHEADLDDQAIIEEAYLTNEDLTPKEVFQDLYENIYLNINSFKNREDFHNVGFAEYYEQLKKTNPKTNKKDAQFDFYCQKEVNLYFNVTMWDFYQGDLTCNVIVAMNHPQEVRVYELAWRKTGKFQAKRIDNDDFVNNYDGLNRSLLKNTFDFKDECDSNDLPLSEIGLELYIDQLREEPFSLEKLLLVYGNIFNPHHNILNPEVAHLYIERLKYIICEKYVASGVDYILATKYTTIIFNTINDYKEQVIKAVNGEGKFPKNSLPKVMKKLTLPQVGIIE